MLVSVFVSDGDWCDCVWWLCVMVSSSSWVQVNPGEYLRIQSARQWGIPVRQEPQRDASPGFPASSFCSATTAQQEALFNSQLVPQSATVPSLGHAHGHVYVQVATANGAPTSQAMSFVPPTPPDWPMAAVDRRLSFHLPFGAPSTYSIPPYLAGTCCLCDNFIRV
jgi:hypothetical protein